MESGCPWYSWEGDHILPIKSREGEFTTCSLCLCFLGPAYPPARHTVVKVRQQKRSPGAGRRGPRVWSALLFLSLPRWHRRANPHAAGEGTVVLWAQTHRGRQLVYASLLQRWEWWLRKAGRSYCMGRLQCGTGRLRSGHITLTLWVIKRIKDLYFLLLLHRTFSWVNISHSRPPIIWFVSKA